MFSRSAFILDLTVNGRIIGTTSEHPFWVVGKGWTLAKDLQVGDALLGHSREVVYVEAVDLTDRYETVYNFEVEDEHTYFVGERAWGWSVWSHNNEWCKGGGNWEREKLRRRGGVLLQEGAEDLSLGEVTQQRYAYEIGFEWGENSMRNGKFGKFFDTDYVNPRYYEPWGGPGIDAIFRDSQGNPWVIDYEGNKSGLTTMTPEWLNKQIRYMTKTGDHWGPDLLRAWQQGKLRGAYVRTPAPKLGPVGETEFVPVDFGPAPAP